MERALQSAVRGARVMAKLSGYDRFRILRKAAELMVERQEDLGRTISLEEGKALAEGRLEANRAVETMLGSAEEAKRIHGETHPARRRAGRRRQARLHAARAVRRGGGDHPVQLPAEPRVPQGRAGDRGRQRRHREAGHRHAAVGAQAHRDPARSRPAAGGHPVPHRPGRRAGRSPLPPIRGCARSRFTGSRDVGEHICRTGRDQAGDDGARLERPGDRHARRRPGPRRRGRWPSPATPTPARCASRRSGSSPPGRIYSDLLDALKPRVEAITTGNQLDEKIKMGPMVREKDAVRVDEWIDEAVERGRPAGHRRRAARGGLRADASSPTSSRTCASPRRSCSAPRWP